MKNILIYPIRSLMSHGDMISKDSEKLLSDLREALPDYSFSFISSFEEIKPSDFVLILVQSGGSEGIFKKEILPSFEGPYYLLTYGSSNSLAASLEILTFLKQRGKKSEVLHGNNDYMASRIASLYENKEKRLSARLGVLGTPSDWLISSSVDYQKCLDVLGIELIDIPQEEVVAEIQKVDPESLDPSPYDYEAKEIRKALQIYEGLKVIVKRHHLDGFTIRCFDIIQLIKSSACLAIALFNKEGIIASCEGDIPAMLTALLVRKRLNINAFQANPQWIEPVKNEIELAHCTLPLDMCDSVTFDTHFESGIGVGIHGELRKGDVTIVKIGASLDEFYCEEGTLIENAYRKDRCRTQIKIALDAPVSYFLSASLGNHHQIVYGHHKKELKEYLQALGLRNVVA